MICNMHYIRIDKSGNILHGFSDAFEQPQDGDICINEKGSYQFRLIPGGEENPRLVDDDGKPLYRWENNTIAGSSSL